MRVVQIGVWRHHSMVQRVQQESCTVRLHPMEGQQRVGAESNGLFSGLPPSR